MLSCLNKNDCPVIQHVMYLCQVFARTVICRDLDVATRVARNDGLDCITLEGCISVIALCDCLIVSLLFLILTIISVIGDQVSKKGGMTGGFYDYGRSKLRFMNISKSNNKLIEMKECELKEVNHRLQNILLFVLFSVLRISSMCAFCF